MRSGKLARRESRGQPSQGDGFEHEGPSDRFQAQCGRSGAGRKRLYGSTEQVNHHARTDTQPQAAGCGSARRCVVLNEKPLEVMGDDVTQEQAFAHANDVLKNAVGGISTCRPFRPSQ